MIDKINLYISSKDILCDDIFVYPHTGVIQKETGEYTQAYNEYIRDNNYIITNNDENINILLDDIETEINVEYLLSKLAKKEYKVIYNEGDN